LQGPHNGTCLTNYTWSRGEPSCVPLNCPNRILLNNGREVSLIGSSCHQYYEAQCTLFCPEGSTGDDVVYLCNVTSDPTVLSWMPIGGVHAVCERGL